MSGGKKQASRKEREASRRRAALLCVCLAAVLAAALPAYFRLRAPANVRAYQEKAALLRAAALAEDYGPSPAGGQAGQAVFISVCNTRERASVFHGTGPDLKTAWENADGQVRVFLQESHYDPVWVKADVVYGSETLAAEELEKAVLRARHEFYRYGLALDPRYETALLEAEMNGAKIYEYDKGGVDLEYLNLYLKKAGRSTVEALPEAYTVFQCAGWFCDEDKTVYELGREGLDVGRRQVEELDGAYARDLILRGSAFLVDQLHEDGSFVYGMYPRFDNEIEGYNIVRHASTLWSLACRYRLEPEAALAEKMEKAIEYMLSQVVYDGQGRAYLYEADSDEIKLGGCGVAVVALTEYMDAFQNEKYLDVCRDLGLGILTMMDRDTGEYYHVLNGDFTRKAAVRTVYYDGEATFALCRLYGLTGEKQWLTAAETAVDRFIREDYAQYKDHWVAYSMNEITKYVEDNEEYYAFAMENAQRNLETVYERETTYHTYLEMLMAAFEVYERMEERGFSAEGLIDVERLLETIKVRVNRQLNGFFFPEYAMYMRNPARILNAFMVRHDGYRVRIDDVQHNIGGYYLYWKNYEKLVSRGLREAGEG